MKRSRIYADVVHSSQDTSSSGENVIDFESIKRDLLKSDNSSIKPVSPPVLSTDSSSSQNASCFHEHSECFLESTQDRKLLDILKELQNHEPCVNNNNVSTSDERIQGFFCSDTVFNLSNRVLSENEIKVLEKGLDFAPIQRKVNEPELRKDFEEFCRRMRIKWNFRNEPSQNFSNVPVFSQKSSWKPPVGHPNLEVFLSQRESELIKETSDCLRYSNLSQEEW